MASITSWIRLEPRTRDADLAPGVDARVHDPLWAIARQWQLGELDGDDAGSAISIRTHFEHAPIDAVRAAPDASWTPLASPVEIATHHAPAPILLADRIRSGRLLARAVTAAGAALEPFLTRYPLLVDATLEPADRRLVAATAGRVPDGARAAEDLAGVLAAGDLPAAFGLGTATAAASAACRAWLEREHAKPAGAWRDERLARAFELRAGPFALVADHQTDATAVRWFDVDVRPLDGATQPMTSDVASTLPSRPHFRGMPSRRYWELEDGAVHWPSIDSGPGDVARLLFVEFAVTFADDWLVVPLELPSNSLARITSVVATDTFGVDTVIRPASDLDGPPHPWRFCELTSRDTAGGAFVVTLAEAPGALTGPALDAADLVRDDISNVYWGVERTRRGADGRPRDVALAAPAEAPTPAIPRYRIGPAIGDAFHPYFDRVDDAGPALIRGSLPGRTLALAHPILPARLDGAAAPVRPLRLARVPLVVRSPDGTYHEIVARSVAPAAVAPPTPALLFDRVERS